VIPSSVEGLRKTTENARLNGFLAKVYAQALPGMAECYTFDHDVWS